MTDITVEVLQQTIDIEVQEQVIELEAPQATIFNDATIEINYKTNYDLAVEEGFEWTLEEYLDSLIWPQGEQWPQGIQWPQWEPWSQGTQWIQGIQWNPWEKGDPWTTTRTGITDKPVTFIDQKNVDWLVLDYVNETYITDDIPRSASTYLFTQIQWWVNSRIDIEIGISWIIPDEYYTQVLWPNNLNLIITYPWQNIIDISSVTNATPNISFLFIAWNIGYKLSFIKIRYIDTANQPQEIFTNFISKKWNFGFICIGSYIVNNKQWISVVRKWDDFFYINETNNLVQEINNTTINTYNDHISNNNFVTSAYALDKDYNLQLNKEYVIFNISTIDSIINWHMMTQMQSFWSTFNLIADTLLSQSFALYIDDNLPEWSYFYVRTWTVTWTKIKQFQWNTITIEWLSEYTMLQNMSYHFMYYKKENDLKLVSKSSI